MNRREALKAIGIGVIVCPTAVLAIPENTENPDNLPVPEFGEHHYNITTNSLEKLLVGAEKIISIDNNAIYKIKILVNKINAVSISLFPEFNPIGCNLQDLLAFHKYWGNMILYIRTESDMCFSYWFATDGLSTNMISPQNPQ